MDDSPLPAILRKIVRGEVRPQEPLYRHSSFRIGGPAEVLLVPEDVEDVASLQGLAWSEGIPLYIIGLGTNLLFPDEGLPGIVLKLGGRLNQMELRGSRLTVGGGAFLAGIARTVARGGLSGLEFAEGIPGTVGGAVYMNAGAFGGNMAQIVRRVWVCGEAGKERELTGVEMGFCYRSSRLQSENGWVITGVEMELREEDPVLIKARMTGYREKRLATQPRGWPSAGSVFKNPPGEAAARLIERVGAKGWQMGGAQVSSVHANFIINRGGARARDVLSLMARVQKAVEEATGIWLEPEVRVIAGPTGAGDSG